MATRKHPRFGDRVINTSAGEGNPHREAFFIRVVTTRGRLNKGTWYECTDGMGNIWQQSPSATEVTETRAERDAAVAQRDEALARQKATENDWRDAEAKLDAAWEAAGRAQRERDTLWKATEDAMKRLLALPSRPYPTVEARNVYAALREALAGLEEA